MERELEQGIVAIREQFRDILRHFCGDRGSFILEPQVRENPYGGNPDITVHFSYDTGAFTGREKVFCYQMCAQTREGFLNEIKAYMLDCVDGFVNLL